jgi:organic radical activating enzyme
MILSQIDELALENIKHRNLPVYVHGFEAKTIFRLLRLFDEHQIKCNAVFLKTGSIEANETALKWCAERGIPILEPPQTALDIPKGIVICATELFEEKHWIEFYTNKGYHTVYKASTIFAYPSYKRCLENYPVQENLLERCRDCPANCSECPIRTEYYLSKGENCYKAINRLLVRCGFICNYRCDGCCQYIPQFTDDHIRNFSIQEIEGDLVKAVTSIQYVNEVWLEGGEAMLWQGFPKIVEAVARFPNIARMTVLTNGSYIPNEKVMKALSENRERITVEINAYEVNNHLEELTKALENNAIQYKLRNKYNAWVDFTDNSYHDYSDEELYDKIPRKCRFYKRNFDQWMLTDGRLSTFCCQSGYIRHYLRLYEELSSDDINIRDMKVREIPAAMDKMYNRGNSEACRYCAGAFNERFNKDVAKQLY